THLRNEGDTLVEAVQEALDVVERAGLPLQLSHHKAEGEANWGKVRTTLGMVEAARARGLDVQLDQYPYTAFMTGLGIQTLPRWVLSGTPEETQARLIDPAQRAAILAEMRAAHPDWDETGPGSHWSNVQIGVCRHKPELQGRTIASLSIEVGRNPIEYVLDLLSETTGFVSAVNFAIGEEDIAAIMRYPWTAIGSDGVGTHPGGTGSQDQIHPRAYGTFPRVLGRYVRELGVLTEAEAIHKMTGLPAARLGIRERGRILPGFFADLTLYDPARVGDRATFAEPHQFAVGIEAVLVNGRLAHESGAPNGTLAGRVLRHL
ncbi:MAG TPA: amidohydrolase family protein, partial [Chthonomonadaceae bacterium]|nr:amidohydrolase family protein [Chthonomonadaceae bacterium]